MEQQENHKHNRRRRRTQIALKMSRNCFKEERKIQLQTMYILSRTLLVTTIIISSLLFLKALEITNAQQVLTSGLQLATGGSYLLPGNNMEQLRISELQPVGSVVYQLKAVDKSGQERKISYALTGDTFSVDEETGEVRLMKQLDRERQAQISTVVNVLASNSDQPLESRRRVITVEDVDDSWPIFGAHKLALINNAQLGQYVYRVELSEQTPKGTLILGELIVTDADEGANAELLFECRARQSSAGACELFSLESRRLQAGRYSVSVRTQLALDYERAQSHKLVLVARGRRPSPLKGVPLEAEAVINIQLTNQQDEPPVFVNAPYALSMHEGLRPGTRLLTLLVQDGDLAPQRELSMIVVDGPFKEHFQVTKDPDASKVWYLESNATIDRESLSASQLSASSMFSIGLLAAELDESGSPVASELELLAAMRGDSIGGAGGASRSLRREQVSVVLLDLADSRPVFVHSSSGRPLQEGQLLVVNVSESLGAGATLSSLDLALQDHDEGANARIKLALVDAEVGPQASEAFALDTQLVHGRAEVLMSVKNASLLDYEEPALRTYRFSLIASKQAGASDGANGLHAEQPEQLDGVPKALVQILQLQVNVLDANDNWPEFERDQYVVSVPEGSLPGHLVATIKARDRDSGLNGRVDYMLRGSGASKFKLISSEGKILVNDCGVSQCLDYETQPTFALNYEARDGGGLTRNVSVIINLLDANDHAPKFTELVYRRELISDNLSSRQNYISPQLIVRARDADGPTQGRNNITYRISRTNLTGLEVEPSTGLVYISQPLDLDAAAAASQPGAASRERKLVFEAQVLANDNGMPPLNSSAIILLTVKGERDGAPRFKQEAYIAYVRENQPIGKPFFQVQALDPDDRDSQLRYSLGFDLNDLLQIDAKTGELAFKRELDYDDFRGLAYNISVHATDNSKPYPLRDTTLVSILVQDVNNKKPRFEQPEYRATLVQGKTRPGDQVLQVRALDLDKSHKLVYTLIANSLSLADRNGQQFKLDELANATSGYLEHMGRAERLQLVDSLRRLFAIDKHTGVIELASEPDYSYAAELSFQVSVVDVNQEVFGPVGELQQDYARCNLFLQTQGDKRPVFAPPWSVAQPHYNLSIIEELPVGAQIFSLLARDPQTSARLELFEKVAESDERNYFRVERSGLVLINRRIDYEELPFEATATQLSRAPKLLSVSVRALTSDSLHSAIAQLNIRIIDVNDNWPQFKNHSYKVAVSEALEVGKEIVQVSAEDRDSGELGQVYYSLAGFQAELFQIDARLGLVSLRRGSKLDRESEPNYYLLVTASDCNDTSAGSARAPDLVALGGASASGSCKKSTVPLEITLIDENDNEPVFVNANKRAEFEATTSETVAAGSVIAQLQARDPDEGPNGQLSYEIVKTDEQLSRLLKIDAEGQVSATGSLAGLGRPTPYRVSVRAYDQAGARSSRQAYATLLLTIQDVVANDGVPRFVRPRPGELITLSESAGPNTFVYQVQAVDPDEEPTGRLMYKFAQASDTFDIDPFEGVIKTQQRANFYLDREQVANYTLILIAQDFGQPPKQAQQVLTIRISDVNDNEPHFERSIEDAPLVLLVDEELPRGSLLGTIRAVDMDEGSNALIGYEIIEGNANNLFRLASLEEVEQQQQQQVGGNNPCHIYSNGRLDREARQSHTLTIKASSMSRMRNQLIPAHLRDPLGGRNPFNQYNASDLSKIRVTIQLLDVNDNRPKFVEPNPKSIVDSSAEVYSQLMVIKAFDADSSSSEMQYSILEAFYHSDNKFNTITSRSTQQHYQETPSMRHLFDIERRSGILRNSLSLRPYTDGYFEVYVKADSGQLVQQTNDKMAPLESRLPFVDESSLPPFANRCDSSDPASNANQTHNLPLGIGADNAESCSVAITKAVVFVTHQRETFRFVFNKTKLNDRLDEFKGKVQQALEDIMFEPAQVQASYAGPGGAAAATASDGGSSQFRLLADGSSLVATATTRPERVFLNTFQTDFYEREDGSLDFSTLTSCSQLVKFDDRNNAKSVQTFGNDQYSSQFVPNQVVNYDEVLSLLKAINATQSRQQQQPASTSSGGIKPSLFSQYGLVKIERCLPDKTMYKMTLSERLALYFAAMIALVSILLAFIVSKMRKSYEKNLKILQRSKYHYGMATAASPFGA